MGLGVAYNLVSRKVIPKALLSGWTFDVYWVSSILGSWLFLLSRGLGIFGFSVFHY